MKKKGLRPILLRVSSALAVLLTASCAMLGPSEEGKEVGELRIAFSAEADMLTRAVSEIPDTGDFILTVTGPDGDVIYDGSYGASPESMMVDAGSYTIFVRSCEFEKPAFSSPQYGDEQVVVVPSGGVADVKLTCVQLNAGIYLKIDSSFLTGCSDGVLFLKSSKGKLMYGYSEKRTAYFHPGSVSLVLNEGGVDKVLMTRSLNAQEMLGINVSAASSGASSPAKESISVAVDTSRVWMTEDYVIGGTSDKGDDFTDALTVSQALASVGEEDIWVCGYVVGGDLSSSSASFEKPFSSKTNILIGPRSSTKDKDVCLSVQLAAGDLRDDLNLVDNPSMLGRKVYLKGDIVEAYYGIPGIKNITDYEVQ